MKLAWMLMILGLFGCKSVTLPDSAICETPMGGVSVDNSKEQKLSIEDGFLTVQTKDSTLYIPLVDCVFMNSVGK